MAHKANKNRVKIGNKWVGDGCPVFTIAEIGKNFIQTKEERPAKEYLSNAKKLIKAAKEAGADAVKFQTHNLEDEQMKMNIVSPHFTGKDRYNWIKRNEKATSLKFWSELKKYCQKLGIIFFSTPMSRGAAMKLEKVGVPAWKVGSADPLDFVMLDYIAKTKKPIIISFGMTTLKETDKAVKFLKKRTNEIILMHCVSRYPCPPEKLNIGTIGFLKKRYDLPVGFSDHSIGYETSLAATKMGAAVLEKHFSQSRDLWGADHKVSATPQEFKEMVDKVKNRDKVSLKNYGKSVKVLQSEEAVFRPIFRKALVAGRAIKAGSVLAPEMIFAMRPQRFIKGLPSEEYEKVIGKKLKRNLKKYDPINWSNLEK
jgi:sialic acid synthase SpsE